MLIFSHSKMRLKLKQMIGGADVISNTLEALVQQCKEVVG